MSGILDKLDKLDPANRRLLAERLRQSKEKHATRPAHAEPIAVVGIACRFPGGARTPDRFWELLMQGRSGVSRVPADRFPIDDYHDEDPSAPGAILSDRGAFIDGVDAFDAAFFGVSPREARRMDPQHRQLLEVAWEALENAGLTQASLRKHSGDVGGVFIGLMGNDYFATVQESPSNIDAYTSTGTHYSFAANRLSFHLDLKGPSMAIDSACSSSLVAVHQACQSLRTRDCDFAIAGGVNLVLSPTLSISYSKWGMLSPDGECKTFDASANGFVRGEGAGVVVLKRLDDALAHGDPILAVVRGSAVNQDGATSVITAPNGLAQQALIGRALKASGVDPGAVGYVEAHGTGTSLGDPIEVEALNETYGKAAGNACVLGAVKTNVGHLEGAAGIAGFIKAVLAVHHGRIPPNRNFRQLNPLIRFEGSRLRLANDVTEWTTPRAERFAAVSSFGAGGTNAHVIVQGAPERPIPSKDETARASSSTVCVSAKSERSLRKQVQRLAGWLRREGCTQRIEDIAYTALQRRNHFEHRAAFTVDSSEGLLEAAEAFLAGRAAPSWCCGSGTAQAERPVFVFSGQGSQWRGMGRGLMASHRRFAAEIAAIDRDFVPFAGWSIAQSLTSGRELDATEIAQPCLFAVQMALVACLEEMGIRPAAVVGHSVGEIAAACVAGVMDRAAATALVFHRARLMQRLTGAGKMAAIGLAREDIEARLEAKPGLAVAAVNGPRSVVVAGEAAPLEALVHALRAEGVFTRMLPVDYAFHSPQADAILDELRQAVDGIFGPGARTPAPRLPIVSTVTGAELSEGTEHAAHWTQNVRRPVVFAQAVAQLLEQGHDTFLEVGAHPVLQVDLGESFQAHDARARAVATLRREQDEAVCLRAVPAALYTAGVSPDVLPGPRQGALVSLPNYAWEHRRHWLDTAMKWVHSLDWEEVQAPAMPPRRASWLVVGTATALVDALCAHLHAQGHAVSRATPDAVRAVVAVSEFDRVDFVVYVPESVEENHVESSCLSLVRLVQALEKASSPSKVWIVTRGAQVVTSGESVQPFAAPVWGLGRVLALEAHRAMAGLIDLPLAASDDEVPALVSAMLQSGGEDQIALRANRRYGLRLRPRAEQAHTASPWELDPSGLYLVTGGTRGLGLLAAKRLAERGARHLALLARRAPEANAIRELEELGVTVSVHAADVSDPAAMRVLFDAWTKGAHPLKGIVHAAGVSRDVPFAQVDEALLAETLAPKVAGTWCLHQLSLEHPLDFFIVYSSAASVWGSSGLGPYAAANEFLNAVAAHRRALGLPALSVCWGMWDAEGMTTAERRQSWTRLGMRAMAPERALDALEELVASGVTVAAVADVKWTTFRPIYEMNGRRPLLAALASAETSAAAPPPEVEAAASSLKEQWQNEPASQQCERVLALLRETAARVLGLDARSIISAEQGLFSMGFDSVTAVEFTIRLNRLLGTGYSATMVFDHPTLKEIRDLVMRDCFGWTNEAPAEEPQGHDLEALLAFVENVNDDEAERLLAQPT
ncbi:type I polyketide synthase [Pendulispora brunnea]|uniref:Type I polyketide synthase n=1 Tax=Pendulispora brunnea TaxID=2905690 RepID=A0ABZ2K0Z9_9BACT